MKHPFPKHLIERHLEIAVVGCGGNGSQMLAGLARFDRALRALGHPGLRVHAYDPDTVTDANVGRQLFSPADVGQSKAVVLINRLNLYYGLKWEARAVRYTWNTGCNPDFLIGCVDSVKSRKEIIKPQGLYWLDLGNTDKKGQVILGELRAPRGGRIDDGGDYDEDDNAPTGDKEKVAVRKDRLPHFFDLFPELKKRNAKEDDAPSCSLAEALDKQDLFINQTIATFALQLLWTFFRQGGLNIHGFFINLETGRVTPLPIKEHETPTPTRLSSGRPKPGRGHRHRKSGQR